MPIVNSREICRLAYCKNKRQNGSTFCSKHDRAELQEHRKYRSDNYSGHQNKLESSGWHKTRKVQLSTQPICARCFVVRDQVQPADSTDHILPVAWASTIEEGFYTSKLQSLCRSCHSVKTNYEQQGVALYYCIESKEIIQIHRDQAKNSTLESPENLDRLFVDKIKP